MKYLIKAYDRELNVKFYQGEWENESTMLNNMMKRGCKPIEWWWLV